MPSLHHHVNRLVVLATVCGLCTAGPAVARRQDFVAMGDGRFALTVVQEDGVQVRFAKDQFSGDDKACVIFGVGSSHVQFDATTRTLLLELGDESYSRIVAFAPDGRELYRTDGAEIIDWLSLVPGAGLFCRDGPQASLHDCRTGAVVRKLDVAGPGEHTGCVVPLGGDLLLVECYDDSGVRELVAVNWRTGAVAWRRQVAALNISGRGKVAADETRVFIVSDGGESATLTSRSRADGAILAQAPVPARYVSIAVFPDQPWLLVYAGISEPHGRLALWDKATLTEVRELPLPDGLKLETLFGARALADGSLLLDGIFSPDRTRVPHPVDIGQVIVGPAREPTRVRAYAHRLAVDPAGNGWLLRWHRQEVGGEAPQLSATDLDPERTALPDAVLGRLEELDRIDGPELSVYSAGGMSPGGSGTTAFDALLTAADLCFAGTIDSVKLHCLGGRAQPVDGVAEITFLPGDVLWGPRGSGPVYLRNVSVPGCVRYQETPSPEAGGLVAGRRFLVAARRVDGAFLVEGRGLFALDADATTAERQGGFAVPDPLGRARDIAARLDLRGQWDRAELVVEAAVDGEWNRAMTVTISRAYKGEPASGQIEVVSPGDGDWPGSWIHHAARGGQRPEGDYVLFLKSCGKDRYELLEGRWSVLRHVAAEHAYYREGELLAPEAAAVLGAD